MNPNNYANRQVNIAIKVEELVEIDAAWKELIEEIEGVSKSEYFKSLNSYDLLETRKIYREFHASLESNKLSNYAFKEYQRLSSFEYILTPDANDDDSILRLDGKINLLEGSEILISMDIHSLLKLFDVADEYKSENMRREMLAERDDWMPPENFKDGTDEEQEIWKIYYEKQKHT